MNSSIHALSPLDGRYFETSKILSEFLSERALTMSRVRVEFEWLKHLAEVEPLSRAFLQPGDQEILATFDLEALDVPESVKKVQFFESQTHHDVKAVEYFLREKLLQSGLSKRSCSMLHFGCTSEDINNIAYALMLKNATSKVMIPAQKSLLSNLAERAGKYKDVAMISRTHGQKATPTTLGKEVGVFGHRLKRQVDLICASRYFGKMNGAVGNYNAHVSVMPEINWQQVSCDFVEAKLGLSWNPVTTQIDSHDWIAELVDCFRRINTIGIDLSRDVWSYISMGYFVERPKEGEVGSSTMPHKINPIHFENAEGNFALSSSLCDFFANKLPISRLQRDLSDSTVKRSLGVCLGHHLVALTSLLKGFSRLDLDANAIQRDIEGSWEVLAEPLQMQLRLNGAEDAYERIRDETRGKPVTKEAIRDLIQSAGELSQADKKHLLSLRPETYTGLAAIIAEESSKTILSNDDFSL